MVKKKGGDTEPLTNSAHHSKPFFTGRRQSKRRRTRRRRRRKKGVVSNKTGVDWTEKKKSWIKGFSKGRKHPHLKTLGPLNS